MVSICDDDALDWYKQHTVKQHQVVYLRKMVPLYAKGRHYVNAQGRSRGGSLEGLLIK